jgi:hypothetical protein
MTKRSLASILMVCLSLAMLGITLLDKHDVPAISERELRSGLAEALPLIGVRGDVQYRVDAADISLKRAILLHLHVSLSKGGKTLVAEVEAHSVPNIINDKVMMRAPVITLVKLLGKAPSAETIETFHPEGESVVSESITTPTTMEQATSIVTNVVRDAISEQSIMTVPPVNGYEISHVVVNGDHIDFVTTNMGVLWRTLISVSAIVILYLVTIRIMSALDGNREYQWFDPTEQEADTVASPAEATPPISDPHCAHAI